MPRQESIHDNITEEELHQVPLDFLKTSTTQLNLQLLHQVKDPANEPNLFYNLTQQKQNIATPSQQFIPKK